MLKKSGWGSMLQTSFFLRTAGQALPDQRDSKKIIQNIILRIEHVSCS